MGDVVTKEQSLLAARRVALADLQRAEKRCVALAGWIGPYDHPLYKTWRCPMNGRDTSTVDALAQIRVQIEREWGPPKSKPLA